MGRTATKSYAQAYLKTHVALHFEATKIFRGNNPSFRGQRT